MTKSKTKPALPRYKKPPVVEVVCGLRFKGLEGFKIPHYGEFWSSIKKDFPRCEHAQPLEFGPGIDDGATGLPVPRIWLVNNDEDKLLQLQKNTFLYNWRKRGANTSYPSYDKIIVEYKKFLNKYISFVSKNKLGDVEVSNCELTYVNMIPQEHGWKSTRDFGKIFTDIGWKSRRGRFLPPPSQLGWRGNYSLPNGEGELMVTLDQRRRLTDEAPVLMFELSAKGLGEGKKLKDIWAWYDQAHNWIVNGFADLTHDEVQKNIWKKHG